MITLSINIFKSSPEADNLLKNYQRVPVDETGEFIGRDERSTPLGAVPAISASLPDRSAGLEELSSRRERAFHGCGLRFYFWFLWTGRGIAMRVWSSTDG